MTRRFSVVEVLVLLTLAVLQVEAGEKSPKLKAEDCAGHIASLIDPAKLAT